MAMMVYCNPLCLSSPSGPPHGPSMSMSFHVSKDMVRYVLRCVKVVWQRENSAANIGMEAWRAALMAEIAAIAMA